jgi:hypothetical protein
MRLGLLLLVGCNAASSQLGLSDVLQIPGAQYRPGPFPEDHGGPAASQLNTTHAAIAIDHTHEPVEGILALNARSGIFGIVGVDGAWIVPASPPDIETLGMATVRANISLTPGMPTGPFTLQVAAGDVDGVTGSAALAPVIAVADPPPAGQLVVTLEWNGAADLDLHVVDALGGEAWSDKPDTFPTPPPGTQVSPTAFLVGGILDHDGNGDCRRDGEPDEHIIWRIGDSMTPPYTGGNLLPPPPSGTYTVRVDARSLCGDPDAFWDAFASTEDGTVVGEARGIAVPDQVTYDQHGAGAGVTAFQFTLP